MAARQIAACTHDAAALVLWLQEHSSRRVAVDWSSLLGT